MTQSRTAVFILLTGLLAFCGNAYAGDTVEELKVCARIAGEEARLACFDNLGERVLREESVDEKPAQEDAAQPDAGTTTAPIVQPLPDDIGDPKVTQYAVFVTSCTKGRSGDWYFFFENGQVWKQVSDRNLRLKECNASATITRDAFGYKMQMDGMKKTVRIRRHR